MSEVEFNQLTTSGDISDESSSEEEGEEKESTNNDSDFEKWLEEELNIK